MDPKNFEPIFETLAQVRRGSLSTRNAAEKITASFAEIEKSAPASSLRALTDLRTSFLGHLDSIERHGAKDSGVRAAVEVLRRRADEVYV
jgi:hypothetical protein